MWYWKNLDGMLLGSQESNLHLVFLGTHGVNHGVELHPDVVKYAEKRLDEWILSADAVDQYQFCKPIFTVG